MIYDDIVTNARQKFGIHLYTCHAEPDSKQKTIPVLDTL